MAAQHLVIPKMHFRLVSQDGLAEQGLGVILLKKEGYVFKLKTGAVAARTACIANSKVQQLVIDDKNIQMTIAATTSMQATTASTSSDQGSEVLPVNPPADPTTTTNLKLWHNRLGHLNMQATKSMHALAQGIPVLQGEQEVP